MMAAEDKFCHNCGAAQQKMRACPRCGNPTVAGDRFCGHCGATVVQAANPPRPRPAAPAAVRREPRVSLWYPASGLGCFVYLIAALACGLLAVRVAADADAPVPTFVVGCLLAYPILTMWRGLLLVRGLIARPTLAAAAGGEQQKFSGASIWAIILTMIAAGVAWKLRHEALRPKPNYQQWRQTQPGSEQVRPRTRSTDGVRQRR